jgi:hypothetical protein
MDGADVRMIESRRRSSFHQKAVSPVLQYSIGRKEFEGDESPQTLVYCLEDFAHAALPELRHKPIVEQFGARKESRLAGYQRTQFFRIEKGVLFRVIQKQPLYLSAQVEVL